MRRTIREKEPLRPSTRLSTMHGEELTQFAQRRATRVRAFGSTQPNYAGSRPRLHSQPVELPCGRWEGRQGKPNLVRDAKV